MIDLSNVPELNQPLMIVSFAGWNDAAEAATGAVDHLMGLWDAKIMGSVDPEDYYDYQVNRPMVQIGDDGMRRLIWPGTTFSWARPPGLDRDVIFVRGVEPNMRWRQFCSELLALIDELDVDLVVTLGALLAEAPHTRPIAVSGTTSESDLNDRLNLEESRYEGPTGIVGALVDACAIVDVPSVSYWAAVPHYLPQPPCPRAVLALLGCLEELLQASIAMGELPEEARAWERGVAELLEDDPDIAEYVEMLEENTDTTSLPEASGEAIAAEFERYLKRRGSDG